MGGGLDNNLAAYISTEIGYESQVGKTEHPMRNSLLFLGFNSSKIKIQSNCNPLNSAPL